MKLIPFYVLLAALLMASCSEEVIVKEQKVATVADQELTEFPPFNWDTLKGTYFGDFSGSDIRLTITFISGKNVVGYNVYKGLVRNLSGKVSEDAETIHLKLEEPGDNEFDGVFQLDVNKKTLEFTANWDHFGKTISSKYFNLVKLKAKKANANTDESQEVPNNENFHEYFYFVQDSIGEMTFSEKGLVLYSYYPSRDALEKKEQLIEIRGSFSVKGNLVFIDWQPNTVFPSRKSQFKIATMDQNSNYKEYFLEGENRSFYNGYY